MAMLARKAANWQMEQPKVYIGSAERLRRHDRFILDVSAEMKAAVKIVALAILFIGSVMSLQALITTTGYELISMQRQVVQLTKANEQLSLNVAELKSPARIQKIAQSELGMVLPDAFVYSSIGTKIQRNVSTPRPIVD